MKRIHKKIKIGYHVYLRVKPRRFSLKLKICGKLAPIFIGPFEVLDRIGPITYRVAFLANIKDHNAFMFPYSKDMCTILII